MPESPEAADVQEAPDEATARAAAWQAIAVLGVGHRTIEEFSRSVSRSDLPPMSTAIAALDAYAAAVRRSSEAGAMSPKVAAELAFENERAETWRAGYDEGRADERAVAGEAQARIAALEVAVKAADRLVERVREVERKTWPFSPNVEARLRMYDDARALLPVADPLGDE